MTSPTLPRFAARPVLSACTAILLASLAAFLPSCGNSAAVGTAKPEVLCTIFSYYDAARAIAGDKLDVQILLPPNASPHEYETSARDKKNAAAAALYIKNGLGLDDHYDKLVNPANTKILTLGDKIPKSDLLMTQEVPLDDPAAASAPAAEKSVPVEGEGSEGNPHIWLDPHIQITAAQAILGALIDLDPADKATFQTNAQTYIDSIQKLDTDFAAATSALKNKDFIGFHSAYEYLARRYGLHQVASIEEIPGNGLSPAQTRRIINLINADHIHYIAIESAFPEQAIHIIQNATGVKTIVLQPLETYDDLNASYVSYMQDNLKALQTALGS